MDDNGLCDNRKRGNSILKIVGFLLLAGGLAVLLVFGIFIPQEESFNLTQVTSLLNYILTLCPRGTSRTQHLPCVKMLFFPQLLDDMLILERDSTSEQTFTAPDINLPMYASVYLFNVTNGVEWLANPALIAELTEVGPVQTLRVRVFVCVDLSLYASESERVRFREG